MAIVSREIDPDEFYERSFTLADKNGEGCRKGKSRNEKPVFPRRAKIFLSFFLALPHVIKTTPGVLNPFATYCISRAKRFMIYDIYFRAYKIILPGLLLLILFLLT